MLGGAANVANNISELGANCTLIGSIGHDLSGERIQNLFEEKKINFLPFLSNKKTTTKSRVFIDHHQISRLDYEDKSEVELLKNKKFMDLIKRQIIKNNSVVISDYCKGFLSEIFVTKIIEFAKSNNKTVFVDTKKTNLDCFLNSDYVTPNVSELSKIVKYDVKNSQTAINKACEIVFNKFQIQNLVITRSSKGAGLLNRNSSIFLKNKAIKVFDVTGAGDSFISIFSLLKTINFSDEMSLKISTAVGSIAVSKPGTYAVKMDEIIKFISDEK
jgi:D-beta-D-heptose 7-phosphate kinase/D-beta-D-heptose 1-phosphate adenosyltransferase